jgi:hypothetical protein
MCSLALQQVTRVSLTTQLNAPGRHVNALGRHGPHIAAHGDVRSGEADSNEEPQERAISLQDALNGHVQIMPGHFSSRSFDRMSRRQPRTALHAEARRRVSQKTSTCTTRAVMVNAFAIGEAGARARATMGSA